MARSFIATNHSPWLQSTRLVVMEGLSSPCWHILVRFPKKLLACIANQGEMANRHRSPATKHSGTHSGPQLPEHYGQWDGLALCSQELMGEYVQQKLRWMTRPVSGLSAIWSAYPLSRIMGKRIPNNCKFGGGCWKVKCKPVQQRALKDWIIMTA